MQTVHKYSLLTADTVDIIMPKDAKILHIDVQDDRLCMWALIDSKRTLERRRFRIAGTGHELKEPKLEHLGSALLYNGKLVLHVFEVLG